jgi:hypothetical protein
LTRLTANEGSLGMAQLWPLSIHWHSKRLIRRRGGIEPLHVSMPHELRSCPSTSPTHLGRARVKKRSNTTWNPCNRYLKQTPAFLRSSPHGGSVSNSVEIQMSAGPAGPYRPHPDNRKGQQKKQSLRMSDPDAADALCESAMLARPLCAREA